MLALKKTNFYFKRISVHNVGVKSMPTHPSPPPTLWQLAAKLLQIFHARYPPLRSPTIPFQSFMTSHHARRARMASWDEQLVLVRWDGCGSFRLHRTNSKRYNGPLCPKRIDYSLVFGRIDGVRVSIAQCSLNMPK